MADLTDYYGPAATNVNGTAPQPAMGPQQAPSINGMGSINVGLSGPGLPVVAFAVLALVGALVLLHLE